MRLIRYFMLGCLLVLPLTSRAQEEDEKSAEDRSAEIAEWKQNLDIQELERKAEHRQAMRGLDLRERQMELARDEASIKQPSKSKHCGNKDQCGVFLLACAVVHVLLAIWVFQDIRQRKAGSGVWIVIVLITGLLGAFVYALVRIGDASRPITP